ncbi:serine/threonine protein phosphatase [Muricauda sp. CAU 1633]|uniref:metallophosphoesterase family protein n=1 Tax=Allomuricauda sp. CAU 1633 TaxID=2816036 RepID=UPI001A8F3ADD|nr:metallophosphoesterase family protein [Muricauda sp. CAU 1633]MBO0321157.1 serine/threonine protein phosphatase [Muricauda sp. CAU 1633]
MRTLVVGDIHSGLRALEQLISRAKVTPEDHLIFLGDYVDAWSTAVETVDFLIDLKEDFNCTFIRGNHDELCRDWLLTKKENPQWLAHGGTATRDSYLRDSRKDWGSHLDFYANLNNHYLAEDNRLYLHAGYTNLKGIDFEYFEQSFYWDRTLWELATAIDSNLEPEDPKFPKRLTHYKEVFIGHTPLSKDKVVAPQKGANVWNVDTGAAFMGGLTMMNVETKEFWQSDPVHTFYPGERGRN